MNAQLSARAKAAATLFGLCTAAALAVAGAERAGVQADNGWQNAPATVVLADNGWQSATLDETENGWQ
ncbi:hypothetical protein [Streptomyces antimicrobicus]|uniref:Uncharacterized protein n=1 Tax=Streptomyces antimicrobicus TaxID=2883108 RepID=A0ABS8B1D8_9ACTN|nr:hypothetical protein [Streptomyces antimicrobicus]MCB5178382.1 hypothetical protein [Streptomyces antimicrobicus]